MRLEFLAVDVSRRSTYSIRIPFCHRRFFFLPSSFALLFPACFHLMLFDTVPLQFIMRAAEETLLHVAYMCPANVLYRRAIIFLFFSLRNMKKKMEELLRNETMKEIRHLWRCRLEIGKHIVKYALCFSTFV